MTVCFSRVCTALMFLTSAALVSGCLSGGGDDAQSFSGSNPAPSPNPSPSPPPPPTANNSAPTISGTPPSSVAVGNTYSFTPTASDPDGDPLTFSIENQPSWMNFDPSTGTLSGMAAAGTEGNYSDIQITVSDGALSTSLPDFSVGVTQVALGSATVTWTPPTQNTDGSTLADLAAYIIYYGVSEGSYPNQVRVDNPGVTSFVVENLVPDTYFFVATSVNSNGVESTFSNVATKTVTAN